MRLETNRHIIIYWRYEVFFLFEGLASGKKSNNESYYDLGRTESGNKCSNTGSSSKKGWEFEKRIF